TSALRAVTFHAIARKISPARSSALQPAIASARGERLGGCGLRRSTDGRAVTADGVCNPRSHPARYYELLRLGLLRLALRLALGALRFLLRLALGALLRAVGLLVHLRGIALVGGGLRAGRQPGERNEGGNQDGNQTAHDLLLWGVGDRRSSKIPSLDLSQARKHPAQAAKHRHRDRQQREDHQHAGDRAREEDADAGIRDDQRLAQRPLG